jgi:membrane-bound ClpP family serine protease
MDINLVNFVAYFIVYLFVGFVFFYFTLFKKAGSNVVGTICLVLVFVSLAAGFVSAIHLGILNLFILVIGFWFAYIIMKIYRDDKMEQEQQRIRQEKLYHLRIKKKQMKNNSQ